MPINQLMINFITTAMVFTKGKSGIQSIVLHKTHAEVTYENGSVLRFERAFVIGYSTKGFTPLDGLDAGDSVTP